MKRFCPFAGSAIVWVHLAAGEAAAQPGYSIRGNQVVVNSPGHWKNWEFAEGTLEIGASGELRPRRWRRPANAVLDIVDHLRWIPPERLADREPAGITLLDAVQGVSNREGVVNALDGDMTTFWEPEFLSEEVDLETQWWFVVDLGRIVLADRIVLKFVDESLGDPFLLFDVLVSNGQAPGEAPASGNLDFRPVMQTLHPNKNQRVFEIDLAAYDPGTGSKQSPSTASFREWELADAARRKAAKRVGPFRPGRRARQRFRPRPGDRGKKRTNSFSRKRRKRPGRSITSSACRTVVRSSWTVRTTKDCPRGYGRGVRYYRRERPRLAELEVWGPGDDLASGIVRRGGSIVNTARNFRESAESHRREHRIAGEDGFRQPPEPGQAGGRAPPRPGLLFLDKRFEAGRGPGGGPRSDIVEPVPPGGFRRLQGGGRQSRVADAGRKERGQRFRQTDFTECRRVSTGHREVLPHRVGPLARELQQCRFQRAAAVWRWVPTPGRADLRPHRAGRRAAT